MSPNVADVLLLGCDFMSKNHVVLNFADNTATVKDVKMKIIHTPEHAKVRRTVAAESAQILPNHRMNVPVKLHAGEQRCNNDSVCVNYNLACYDDCVNMIKDNVGENVHEVLSSLMPAVAAQYTVSNGCAGTDQAARDSGIAPACSTVNCTLSKNVLCDVERVENMGVKIADGQSRDVDSRTFSNDHVGLDVGDGLSARFSPVISEQPFTAETVTSAAAPPAARGRSTPAAVSVALSSSQLADLHANGKIPTVAGDSSHI